MEARSNMNKAFQIYEDREKRIQHRCIGCFGIQCMCDLCGKKIPCAHMETTEGGVYFCLNCSEYIGTIPIGVIKDSVMGFLEGNVI
jgi:hypothetical protein